MPHPILPNNPTYGLIALTAIALGAVFWGKRFKSDPTWLFVYIGAIAGMAIGAKLGYLLAEGWMHWHEPTVWWQWAYGKTVVGGLLGGYIGVEICKKMVGKTQATGDVFALAVPLGLAAGRVGCMVHGCCQGVQLANGQIWPAALVEGVFNLLAFAVLLGLHLQIKHHARSSHGSSGQGVSSHWTNRFQGQLFHLYLIAYGLFRLAHEPMRATDKWGRLGPVPVSGYQALALCLAALGIVRGWQRMQPPSPPRPLAQDMP